MCPTWCPSHLLLLAHARANHLIDGRLDEGCGNRLAVPIPVAVIEYERLIEDEILVQFSERFEQFLLRTSVFEALEINLQMLDRLKRGAYRNRPILGVLPTTNSIANCLLTISNITREIGT